MSSDIVPYTGGAAAAGDNRYKAVQAKLSRLGQRLDEAADDLEALRKRMKATADHTTSVGDDIEHAGLDGKFVVLTEHVAEALGGAAAQVGRLRAITQDTAGHTFQVKGSHAKLYGRLDEIRSNRREKTPKPGFFIR
ncbi:conjugal transfer protein TraB [Streptomyces sp. PTM05]|uniref:Conjugal transfer protein TraB n=1 Tax=Streptantibioticus parmotrematis TaxID=2873249 RepID=A0ABS7R1P9_9ACTN|nr:conjugal transfer protein TraB [Streptantibioticus parmotrematis]MBY8889098.1 conjugal transfer protein TraB [Streptantibioticus parmotrematis]